jgi:hypothetical protein
MRPIGRHHPQSSSLPHKDTSPTVSSTFRMLPGNPFLSECQALPAIQPGSSMVSNQHPFSFNFIFGNRKKSQGAKSGEYGRWEMTAIMFFARNCWVRMEVWDSVLSWWSSEVYSSQSSGWRLCTFSCSHCKSHSRTRNSQFGLLV